MSTVFECWAGSAMASAMMGRCWTGTRRATGSSGWYSITSRSRERRMRPGRNAGRLGAEEWSRPDQGRFRQGHARRLHGDQTVRERGRGRTVARRSIGTLPHSQGAHPGGESGESLRPSLPPDALLPQKCKNLRQKCMQIPLFAPLAGAAWHRMCIFFGT
jgi:hypothetical protein